ncbi:MAG: MBOAT family protein [Prolixibacteraceae bacterium]|jgi:alginate O-acetyltransferase complex protein AlgI|nr:MBOAT family protein [Prolixibacteraceae bacterium]
MLDLNAFLDLFRYSDNAPWLFTRYGFWVFFVVVLAFYSLVYKHVRRRNIYLLLFSLFFYYKTGGWFCGLLVFSCLANYIFGYAVWAAKRVVTKKIMLAVGVALNLSVLAYFKYAFFFTGMLNRFFSAEFEVFNWLAHGWNGLTGSETDTFNIILPVGISFFTFQGISYLVDVYRKDSDVVKNVFDFSFYLSFFPQLVAGPIVRASAFIPQLHRAYSITKQEFGHAVFLILAGLVKKMVLSDYLAVNFIDRVFSTPGAYSGAENLMAVYGYALQIYGDFSGYTDIAIGVALLLGFKLPVNFNSPYKAHSLTNFWHRWHISLSTWLRDYLYIPLGGNRKGKMRTHINLLVTMLLGGIWHGANIRFLIWGGIHGLGLVVEKLLTPLRKRMPVNRVLTAIFVFFTFHLVCLGWIFFRAESFAGVQQMFFQIRYSFTFDALLELWLAYPLVFGVMLFGFVVHGLPARFQERVRGLFIEMPIWLKAFIVLAVLFILKFFEQAEIQPFIYFRF